MAKVRHVLTQFFRRGAGLWIDPGFQQGPPVRVLPL